MRTSLGKGVRHPWDTTSTSTFEGRDPVPPGAIHRGARRKQCLYHSQAIGRRCDAPDRSAVNCIIQGGVPPRIGRIRTRSTLDQHRDKIWHAGLGGEHEWGEVGRADPHGHVRIHPVAQQSCDNLESSRTAAWGGVIYPAHQAHPSGAGKGGIEGSTGEPGAGEVGVSSVGQENPHQCGSTEDGCGGEGTMTIWRLGLRGRSRRQRGLGRKGVIAGYRDDQSGIVGALGIEPSRPRQYQGGKNQDPGLKHGCRSE